MQHFQGEQKSVNSSPLLLWPVLDFAGLAQDEKRPFIVIS
jgi:hypothetical protein